MRDPLVTLVFSVGDRVRFLYPNEPTGTGTIIGCDAGEKNKPYEIELDVPWRAYREGRWTDYAIAYADSDQIALIVGE